MKRMTLVLVSVASAVLCVGFWSSALAQSPQTSTVTLYSVNKYREQRNSCISFQAVARSAPCDLQYGALYAGDDLDWFESSGDQGNRTVIKDLGDRVWTAKFEVPVVEPLPKLKPGEHRHISIDTSGADGADGADGAPGQPGADADGVVRAPQPSPASPAPSTPTRPKRDGKPKIDPMFVKAIPGHMYVIHVVDDARDFYALFRVESLERGDQVTVSWTLIPAPSMAVR